MSRNQNHIDAAAEALTECPIMREPSMRPTSRRPLRSSRLIAPDADFVAVLLLNNRFHRQHNRHRGGFRNWLPILAHSSQVKRDCLADQALGFLARGPGCNATRKIGRVSAVPCAGFFVDDRVFRFWHYLILYSPACFRILRSVPCATSSPGCPGIVTRPAFVGACIADDFLWSRGASTRRLQSA